MSGARRVEGDWSDILDELCALPQLAWAGSPDARIRLERGVGELRWQTPGGAGDLTRTADGLRVTVDGWTRRISGVQEGPSVRVTVEDSGAPTSSDARLLARWFDDRLG